MKSWKNIENEREKYAAYLCSREWSVLKEAVKERSFGKCERCKCLPGDAVHHLTYERKYNECLEDLQNTCNPCHKFTHGKSDFDPAAHKRIFSYLENCRNDDITPIPFWALDAIGSLPRTRATHSIDILYSLSQMDWQEEEASMWCALVNSANRINELMPFDYCRALRSGIFHTANPQSYDHCRRLLGFEPINEPSVNIDVET